MSAAVRPEHFRVTRRKLLLIAAAMALFGLAVVWPAFELCRLLLAADPAAFSAARAVRATLCAGGFFLYAYWQMARLALPRAIAPGQRA